MGAVTTNAIPTRFEFTENQHSFWDQIGWQRNWQLLESNKSKSLIYNLFGHDYLSLQDYVLYLAGSIEGIILLSLLALNFAQKEVKDADSIE
jgi:hypothetical protein